jgi:hypothetical protein
MSFVDREIGLKKLTVRGLRQAMKQSHWLKLCRRASAVALRYTLFCCRLHSRKKQGGRSHLDLEDPPIQNADPVTL